MQQESIITLVTNFNLIYLTLIGMTDLAYKNNMSSTAVGDYYEIQDGDAEIKRATMAHKEHVTLASQFQK